MAMLPRRLSTQIFLLVAMVLAATFVAYGWITNTQQAAMLQKTMTTSAEGMVENFAESCAHYLVISDYAGLENFVLRVADLPNILQIQVCETDGKVLADVARVPGKKPAVQYGTQRLQFPEPEPGGSNHMPVIIQDQRMIVWHPITAGTMLGWVKTTFDMQAIAEMRAAVWRNTILLGVLFMAASFILFLVVLRPPLAAIRQLSLFARKLNELKGERVSTNYVSLEIEQLARSLNSASLELRSAEHQLVAERERLAVTLQSIGDGVIATDTDGKIVLINKVAESLTGWPSQEAAGRPLNEVFRIMNEETREILDAPIDQVVQQGKTTSLADHTILVSRDGTERSITDSGAPIVSKDNAVVGVVLVFRDVTEKNAMKAERARLEDQLRQAQKMEAVGQLAGGIAHDFNNMLSAVIGYASLLQKKLARNNALLALVDPILEAANRATTLTHSLLAFSRKQVVELLPIDINAVIGGIERILRRLIREDVEFIIKLQAGPLVVTADKGQLEQVLMNFLTNARDAMPHGGKLMISTEAVSLESDLGELSRGEYAVINISDTGVGMNAETREHIFEPFFTTKDVGKGTGLGLSIVYGIIKQHNGAIHVYSEPGTGSTFRIYLPLLSGHALAVGQVPAAGETLPPGNETILLVEDDRAVRDITKITLESCGYTVLEAIDGDSALTLFREKAGQIHVVLTDIIMPRKDGRALAEEMRRLRPEVKVLFMSGYTADIIDQKGLLAAGMHFLSKPLHPEKLMQKIREVLQS